MGTRVLIVEDEMLLGLDLETTLESMGCEPVGIAPDRETAMALARQARPDLALVDVNLLDGATGPTIGGELARDLGVLVMFLTANPRQLGAGVPGALGVLEKPAGATLIREAVAYALGRREKPPAEFRPFPPACAAARFLP